MGSNGTFFAVRSLFYRKGRKGIEKCAKNFVFLEVSCNYYNPHRRGYFVFYEQLTL